MYKGASLIFTMVYKNKQLKTNTYIYMCNFYYYNILIDLGKVTYYDNICETYLLQEGLVGIAKHCHWQGSNWDDFVAKIVSIRPIVVCLCEIYIYLSFTFCSYLNEYLCHLCLSLFCV